jgi:hypothetical protein
MSPVQPLAYPIMSAAPRGSFLMRGRSGMFVHGMSVTASSFAKRGTMLTIQVESFMHHEISVRYVSNADLPRS